MVMILLALLLLSFVVVVVVVAAALHRHVHTTTSHLASTLIWLFTSTMTWLIEIYCHVPTKKREFINEQAKHIPKSYHDQQLQIQTSPS